MLRKSEIRPGCVAYFDVEVLNGDPAVDRPLSPATRNGPFLCYAVSGDQSAWVEITSQGRPHRFKILRPWRSGGSRNWLDNPQYLNDGATTYRGPSGSFMSAATDRRTDRYGNTMDRRPQVSPVGVFAVREEVARQGGHAL